MQTSSATTQQASASGWDYLELCKPKVVALMLLTSVIGMLLASHARPNLSHAVWAIVGIACAASAAAAINHVIDSELDRKMRRTDRRPLPTGRVKPRQGLLFSFIIGTAGITMLYLFVNALTACLTLASLIGYALLYTAFLKRVTPQNIVIGGLAGAAPPLLGWTAVTGEIAADALLLVLIIFVWTPSHFWALAIHRYDDYARARVPMLPVTHGIAYTKHAITLYTLLLLPISLLPFASGMLGTVYALCAIALGLQYLKHSLKLQFETQPQQALHMFKYSCVYLLLLFCAMLLDHGLQLIHH